MQEHLALAGDEGAWRMRAKTRARGCSEARHCLTSGISGERSESAAWCARHGRGTGGGSPLGALTEGTQHRRGRGVVQREEKASDGSLR